jgi:hypothetical protein
VRKLHALRERASPLCVEELCCSGRGFWEKSFRTSKKSGFGLGASDERRFADESVPFVESAKESLQAVALAPLSRHQHFNFLFGLR